VTGLSPDKCRGYTVAFAECWRSRCVASKYMPKIKAYIF